MLSNHVAPLIEGPLAALRQYDGSSQRWPLRPGLSLIVQTLNFREKAVITKGCSNDTTTLGMSFCLEGQVQRRSVHAEQTVQLLPRQASLGISKGQGQVIEYAAKPLRLVHLHIQPDAIGLGNQESIEQLPDSLKVAMTQCDQTDYFQSHSMSAVMNSTVQQLLNCPYRGLSQRLYLESKAIELMSLYFDQISASNGSQQPSSDLKADEVDRIFNARDILLAQVANPPTLLDLAHQIGLNDRKLKQGFRQVFGTTVFGYLHRYRMQQAQRLLLMPSATIASVAQTIGYRNPEAFSVAFRRTFEIGPKAYQMQQR
ncbi:AraC family transcriptional regulator [Leptolyngbya sp. BC1307]|uniref:helix-turn-helix transcriptional regulator n=1 Tax=Leptolyngbya sp. BC1307 TaxID=2029589 RepID=UPI000EFB8983|nr:AraC family transcriptional regulator [Leptolyngbya sp. BC1307]